MKNGVNDKVINVLEMYRKYCKNSELQFLIRHQYYYIQVINQIVYKLLINTQQTLFYTLAKLKTYSPF